MKLLNKLRETLRYFLDVGRLTRSLNTAELEILRLAGYVAHLEREAKRQTEQYIALLTEHEQLRSEAFRAEQVLTGIKTFAQDTKYRKAGRVILAMFENR